MAVVLVVEDEEQVRVLAESYLEQQEHKVLSAGSPQGAIALLEKTPQIDVLFTDLDLKGDIRAGIKLAQEAIKRWPHLKVLYTTGRDLTDGMKAQFVSKSAFLAKPYTVEELSTALSGLLEAKAEGKYKGRKPTARAKAQDALRLFSQGKKVAHIAKELGIGRGSVYRVLESA
jgi:DNA-binding NtrC family response regulator